MLVLILGLVLFLGAHSIRIVVPGWREATMARYGKRGWLLPYAAVSLIGLVLIIWGYGLARIDPVLLYTPPAGLRHLALLLLLPVFPLLIAAYAPGHIKAKFGHPMLIATILWGSAHLMANGTLADVFLFGGFALWAAIDWVSVLVRPGAPATTTPVLKTDVVAVAGGLVIYAALLGGLHTLLFDVSPIS